MDNIVENETGENILYIRERQLLHHQSTI